MDERRQDDLLIRQVENGWIVSERRPAHWAGHPGDVRGGREYVATSAHALAALVLELTGGACAKPPEVSIWRGNSLAPMDGVGSALFGGPTPVADAAG